MDRENSRITVGTILNGSNCYIEIQKHNKNRWIEISQVCLGSGSQVSLFLRNLISCPFIAHPDEFFSHFSLSLSDHLFAFQSDAQRAKIQLGRKLVRGPQRKEREFLKVGLREKRADLSFPVSPTRGRIRCGTIWLLDWMGIFQNFTFQKVKPNRTQCESPCPCLA